MTSFNWQSIFYYPLVTVLQRINSDQIFVLSSFVSFTFFIRFTLNWMSSVDAWHLSYIWEGHTRERKCGPYRFVKRIYCHVLPSFHSQSVSIFSILSPLRSFFVHTSPSGVFQPRPMISSRLKVTVMLWKLQVVALSKLIGCNFYGEIFYFAFR